MANQSNLLNKLDQYNGRIADLVVSRNPLRDEGWFIFNDEELDQYRDASHIHKSYKRKLVIFNKTPDLEYVQEIGGDTLELDALDQLPYILMCTITDLPRIPKANDQFYCDNVLYTISMVKPANRDSQHLIKCLVYPERDSASDDVLLVSVKSVIACEDSYQINLDCVGTPTLLSVNGSPWLNYESSINVIPSKGSIRVRNEEGLISSTSYSYELIQGVGSGVVTLKCKDEVIGTFNVNQFEDSEIDLSVLDGILSDIRYKKIISDYDFPWQLIDKIPLVTFRWLNDAEDTKPSIGTIAQEVNKVIPEIVNEYNGRYHVEYSKFGLIALKLCKKLFSLFLDLKSSQDQSIMRVNEVILDQSSLIKDLSDEVRLLKEKLQIIRADVNELNRVVFKHSKDVE